MSGRRVLALYAALLFGFAGVLCRLFYLASRTDYAARAAAQSTVTLELPACTPAPTPPDRNCCTAAAAGRLHFSWRWTGT